MTKDVGAAADVHLGRDASSTLKRATLAHYSTIDFAAHGLVTCDAKGLGEPSLARSMPDQPTDFDDGLLTASKIAQLKLNADWVVLSASPPSPATNLVRRRCRDWHAFFYAGARGWTRIGRLVLKLPPG